MNKKIAAYLIGVCLLAALFAGCASSERAKPSKERANLEALLKDTYGSSAIVSQPELDQVLFLRPSEAFHIEHILTAFQLNVTKSEEEFYTGNLYSCVPEKETYAPGEDIRITVTSHNQNYTTGGEPFRLDMLADGKWYAVNRGSSWGLVQYQWSEGSEKQYGINWYLCHFNPIGIDPDTGLIVILPERDDTPPLLPEGTYRFSTWVTDTVEGEEYQLMCQFQVKAK